MAITTYDWVHTLFQGGVFITEVEGFLKAAKNCGITRQGIQDFLRDESWTFPACRRGQSKALHRIFDDRRRSATEPDKVKCSCAEALGVYSLLR